ncbi:MAG: helix-turn-helix domain-containing protein [Candidatus Thorarchaeota archaeon]|jgi:predicted DNA binding protein
MSMLEFRVTHDCPIGDISRRYPSVKMFEWSNREQQVLEFVAENQDDYEGVIEELKKTGITANIASDGQRVHLITRTKKCVSGKNSVSQFINELNLLEVYPIVYEAGWEYFRVVTFGPEEFGTLLKQLKESNFIVEVIRKGPFDGFLASSLSPSADVMFTDLTERQMDALVTAFIFGYYDIPRRTGIQSIASTLGVPRSTYQEHLKKAERKVLSALIPHIQLFRAQVGDIVPKPTPI